MAFSWRELKSLLEANFTRGFDPLLETDYHKQHGVAPLQSGENDYNVEHLLADAEAHKQAVEVEQIIARLQNRQCFLGEHVRDSDHEGASNNFSLSSKYQLLARYYYYRGIAVKFTDVVTKSIIREWPTRLERSDSSTEEYVDRHPLILKLKNTPIRKHHPSYRLRVLALRSSDLKQDFVFSGIARTWLMERTTDGSWDDSSDGQVIELVRQGEDPFIDETQMKDMKRKVSFTRPNAKRGTGSESPVEKIPKFVTSFNVSDDALQFWPLGREKESFSTAEACMKNIVFTVNNVALGPRPGNRKNAHIKYSLASTVSLSLYFYGQPLHIDVGNPYPPNASDRVSFPELIRSMEFEGTSNMSSHIIQIFPFIWRILRSYYEIVCPNEYEQNRGAASQRPARKNAKISTDEQDFLYWKHIRIFLENILQSGLDVSIRTLIDPEVRTIQSVILSRKFYTVIKKKKVDPNIQDERYRKEIEASVMHHTFEEETVNGHTRPFLETLCKNVYRHELDATYKIYEEDFTQKTVKLMNMEQLDFTLHEWLHGIREVLGGSQLHTEKSKMTPLLFDRCILSLRNRLSAIKTMEDVLKKNSKLRAKEQNADNVMMIRFNEYAKQGFVVHFADVNYTDPTFGYIDAKALSTKKIRVKDLSEADFKRAVKAGVMDETKRTEAVGLYVFLRRAYPLHFNRIVERIGAFPGNTPVHNAAMLSPSSTATATPGGGKRSATIVQIVGIRSQTSNPAYDFNLTEAVPEHLEVDPEQGPAIRPSHQSIAMDKTCTIEHTSLSLERVHLSMPPPIHPTIPAGAYNPQAFLGEYFTPYHATPGGSLNAPGPSVSDDFVFVPGSQMSSRNIDDSPMEQGDSELNDYIPNQDIAGQPMRFAHH